MTLVQITKRQCITKLQDYADKEVRSWNPLKLFGKSKLKNHHLAVDLVKILEQPVFSDADLMKIADNN